MSGRPSIKGSVFAATAEDLRKLQAEGAVSEAELARRLEPEDRALLDASILPSDWYDVQVYRRMNELVRDAKGGNEYLRECGRQTARRLLEAGLYAQLEYLQRTEKRTAQSAEERFEAFGRDLRKLTTLSASIFNFGRWAAEADPEHEGRYRIVVADARDFPEVLCWRTEGFVNEMATRHGDPDLWRWERPEPDRVVFRMVRRI